METKDFVEQLDLNEDSQISKEDVKSLWEFLNKKNPKYNKEFVERLEKAPKFKEVLFALEPSFLDVINSKDFVINTESKENIIILQFFAKYFRWENVEINGQFTPETEKLYLESSLQTKNLDKNTFSWNNELELFKTWLWMNDSITIQTVSREEFDKIKPNITEKNNLKWDWKDKPQWYNLKLPEDLKNTEIPLVMKTVNEIAYWEELPEQSAFKTYQSKLEANIKYLEWIENEASQNPDTKIQYEKLMWKLEQMKGDYYWNEDWVDDNIVENELWSISWKISLEFQEIDNEQMKWQKNNPKIKMMLLEKMISKDLRNYMDLAVFERWTETLFDYLTTPTKKEHEYLLDEGKRKEAWVTEIEGHINAKLESMPIIKQKLKDSLGIENMKIELENLEWDKKVAKEKDICNKIVEQVEMYPRTPMEVSQNTQPNKILENQRIVCLWKSIVSWALLKELWIKFDTLNLENHSALMVYLSDGKEYYFDPTNATGIAEFTSREKIDTWIYEKWKIELPNKFFDWWKLKYDNSFSKSDSEFWLMWQMYNNRLNDWDITWKNELLLAQRVIEINPTFIEWYQKLWAIYLLNWNIDEWIDICKKWLKLNKNNENLLSNLEYWISQKIKNEMGSGDWGKIIELTKEWLTYREDAFCLDILAKREIDSWNYDKANEFLSRAWKVAVSQDTITRTIDNLQLLQSKTKWNKSILESVDNVSERISSDLEKSINDNINHEKFEEARQLANELLKIKPWFWYYKLWWISSWENNTDSTIDNLKKAMELAPNSVKEGIKKELDSIKK